MDELIDIYTKYEKKIGTILRSQYFSFKKIKLPWVKCCTCFVIDENTNKILVEKRGNVEFDSGMLDLCSGHVQSNEPPFQSMRRELQEELSIPLEDSESIYSIGRINVDYTSLKDKANRKNLKCFTSVYALKVKDISKIKPDKSEAVSIGWLSFEDICNFIRYNMTRIPYDEKLAEQYDTVFERLENYMYPEKNQKRR